ncbi:protein METABOLIC NETWORK MODULATOR 1 [Silene latifolia]|uniref:protein METABOLIC NETWORK MODULATOR 1 n=1 Tax=Silene latifolia TaxID=37657 RepID=UPI003D7879B4
METNQQNQVSIPFPTPDVTVKKKRGRPRKDPSLNPPKLAYVPRKRGITQSYGESVPVPPGFEESHVPHPQHVDPVNDSNQDSMVGQVVTGVIEAVFDAGFLLSVRVGESNTCLRGVVFKSGHYVPVSAENDLAPGLQMIRRNEVPFPVENHTHKHKNRGRKRREPLDAFQSNGGSPASNQLARVQAGQLAIVPAQSPTSNLLEGRGTLVPVVLQPVTLSNGAKPAVEVHPVASQPAHLSASRSKINGLTQVVPEAIPKGLEAERGPPSQPFEELVSVANKLKQAPHSEEVQNDSAKSFSKMFTSNSGLTQEVQDMSKPLCVEPLQAIRLSRADQSGPMSHPFSERSTGKMTELLLAVQENLKERQMSDTQHQEFRSP